MTDVALGGGASALAPTSASSAFSDDAPSKFTSGFEEEWEMTQDEWNEYKMMFRSFPCLSALQLTDSAWFGRLAFHTVPTLRNSHLVLSFIHTVPWLCYCKALIHDLVPCKSTVHNTVRYRHEITQT